MTEENREPTDGEDRDPQFDRDVNRLILFGGILALMIIVPVVVVMWIAS